MRLLFVNNNKNRNSNKQCTIRLIDKAGLYGAVQYVSKR